MILFSSSEDCSAPTEDTLLLFPIVEQALSEAQDALNITVSMHNHGIQFGLSVQGSNLVNLLLKDPIPR